MVALQSGLMTRDREFVSEVSNSLHLLTDVQQRVTNAYHPQSNGLVERQDRTIKLSCEVIVRNPLKWKGRLLYKVFFLQVTRQSRTSTIIRCKI